MKLILIALLISPALGAFNGTIFYNGTSTYLELRRRLPIELIFYDIVEKNATDPLTDKPYIKKTLGDVRGSVSVNPNATSVDGKSTPISPPGTVKNTLTLKFAGNIKDNSNATLTDLTLVMEFTINNNASRWTLSSIESSYEAKMDDGKTVKNTDSIIVAPKGTGYTPNKADIAYTKGYTTGAGKSLAWTCHDQRYAANLTGKKTGDVAVVLRLQGLRMQPFDAANSNGTYKFGYAWDCDPIISAALWEFFLIGLFFIGILYWSLSMLSSINTPDRFDDPKGKSISVPLNQD